MRSDASYSMETNDSPPETDGQQLIARGTALSSRVWYRHLSTPSGEPIGKGRLGSLRPRMPCSACSCLSMLGWVLNWNPSLAPVATPTRMKASSSPPRISSIIVPCTSIPSIPPSFLRVTLSFSSILRETPSWATAGTPPPGLGFMAKLSMDIATSSPSAASDARNLLVLVPPFAPPSLSPRVGPACDLIASSALGRDMPAPPNPPTLLPSSSSYPPDLPPMP
mmetsp:Transcript_3940/g.16069  ORF Transcript_3940/g.16069 Transcript_3940/m.16069 type:complete len:223 (+) Transcript_3940:481-1149(+)